MFRIKLHRHGAELLLAASDAALIGRTFRESGRRITVHEAFYSEQEADEQALLANLRRCTVANLVGEGVVGVAIRHGFVEATNVLRIEGVPHAQLAVL